MQKFEIYINDIEEMIRRIESQLKIGKIKTKLINFEK